MTGLLNIIIKVSGMGPKYSIHLFWREFNKFGSRENIKIGLRNDYRK